MGGLLGRISVTPKHGNLPQTTDFPVGSRHVPQMNKNAEYVLQLIHIWVSNHWNPVKYIHLNVFHYTKHQKYFGVCIGVGTPTGTKVHILFIWGT